MSKKEARSSFIDGDEITALGLYGTSYEGSTNKLLIKKMCPSGISIKFQKVFFNIFFFLKFLEVRKIHSMFLLDLFSLAAYTIKLFTNAIFSLNNKLGCL
jgi:hypothetical protein